MGRPPKSPRPQPPIARIDTVETSVPAAVVKALTASLFGNGCGPGHRLPSERQLAESLGVSRAAVRDAIQSLGLLGILDVRHGDGTFIGNADEFLPAVIEWGLFLGDRRLLDLVEARQLIEPHLAGLAAKNGIADDTGALLERMHRPGLTVAGYVDLDVAFHLSIATAADNLALADVLRGITGLLRVWMTRSLHAAGSFDSSTDEHRLIHEAIVRGDRRGASAAMRTHLNRAGKRLRSTLSERPRPVGTR